MFLESYTVSHWTGVKVPVNKITLLKITPTLIKYILFSFTNTDHEGLCV